MVVHYRKFEVIHVENANLAVLTDAVHLDHRNLFDDVDDSSFWDYEVLGSQLALRITNCNDMFFVPI